METSAKKYIALTVECRIKPFMRFRLIGNAPSVGGKTPKSEFVV